MVSGVCEAAVCVCLAIDLKNFLQGVVSFFLKDLFYLFACVDTYMHTHVYMTPVSREAIGVGSPIQPAVSCSMWGVLSEPGSSATALNF